MVRRTLKRAPLLSIALLALLGFPPAFAADNDTAPASIQRFEQRLFFKNYSNEDVAARVARIEKRLFGEQSAGSLQQRVEKLNQTLAKELAEEEKEKQLMGGGTGGGGSDSQAQTSAGTGGGATQTGNVTQQGHSSQPINTYADAQERARIAAQAAREEQISSLLSEGVDLYRGKHGAEAATKFSQVLRLDPKNAQAYFNLGIIKESLGNYLDALANYKQAALVEPDNRDYTEAVAAVEPKAEKQKRGGTQSVELKQMAANANAAWKRGEYLSALDLYLQLDAREPNKALVKYNIGSIYMMLKDRGNALSYYEEAHRLAPDDAKYTKAFNEVSAVVNKENAQNQAIQSKAQREFGGGRQQATQTMQRRMPNMQQSGQAMRPTQPMQIMQQPAQTMQQPMQMMQQPMQTMQQPMQTMQQPMQTMQQPMQTMQQPMQTMQQPMQTMQQPMQTMQQPMQTMQPAQMMMAQPMQPMQPAQMMMAQPMQTMQPAQIMMAQPMQTMQPAQIMMAQPMQTMQPAQMMMAQPMQTMQPAQMMMQPVQQPMQPMQQMQQPQMMTQQMPQPQMQQAAAVKQRVAPVAQEDNQGTILSNAATNSPFAQMMTPVSTGSHNKKSRGGFGVSPQNAGQFTTTMALPVNQKQNLISTFGIVGRSNGEGFVVTHVGLASRAASAGLQTGDDIRAVDGTEVSSVNAINDALSKADTNNKVKFVILRNGNLAVLEL